MHRSSLTVLLIATVAVAACRKGDPSPSPPSAAVGTDAAPSTPRPASVDPVAAWQGRWTGPEGTSLEIQPTASGYDVVVTNLDGPRTFAGKFEGGALRFERDGTTEAIKSGNGAQTGMKWLDGKADCLVVKTGEGYCRD